MSNFKKRLKEAREQIGFTQKEFARVAGVSLRAQQNYETTDRKPDVDYLDNLMKIGIDVNYLMTGKHNISTPVAQAIIDAFFTTDEATQQVICKILDIDLVNTNQNKEDNQVDINKPSGRK